MVVNLKSIFIFSPPKSREIKLFYFLSQKKRSWKQKVFYFLSQDNGRENRVFFLISLPSKRSWK